MCVAEQQLVLYAPSRHHRTRLLQIHLSSIVGSYMVSRRLPATVFNTAIMTFDDSGRSRDFHLHSVSFPGKSGKRRSRDQEVLEWVM